MHNKKFMFEAFDAEKLRPRIQDPRHGTQDPGPGTRDIMHNKKFMFDAFDAEKLHSRVQASIFKLPFKSQDEKFLILFILDYVYDKQY